MFEAVDDAHRLVVFVIVEIFMVVAQRAVGFKTFEQRFGIIPLRQQKMRNTPASQTKIAEDVVGK